MSRDAKDFLISDLEEQMSVLRRQLASSRFLNCVLQKHSHLVEKKLDSANRTISKLLAGDTISNVDHYASARLTMLATKAIEGVQEELVLTNEEITEEDVQIKEEIFDGSAFSPQLMTEQLASSSRLSPLVTHQPICEVRQVSSIHKLNRHPGFGISRFNNRKSKTTSKAIYRCKLCTFTSTWSSALYRHSKLHTGEVFHCGINGCASIFRRKDTLHRHQARTHNVLKTQLAVNHGQPFAGDGDSLLQQPDLII